jgi:hypothetical protein
MLANARAPAVLALTLDAVMLTGAGTPAVLAQVPAAVMLAPAPASLRCAHPLPLPLIPFPACLPSLLLSMANQRVCMRAHARQMQQVVEARGE